jgi:hypothetical protein
VAPHELAHRRVAFHAAKQLVLLFREHIYLAS